jgi:hypothetical protein
MKTNKVLTRPLTKTLRKGKKYQQNIVKKMNDAPVSSLMDSTASPKVKTMEEGVGTCFLARSTLGVEGRVGALGLRLGRLTRKSITHTDLHKPNNKLVVCSWSNFGARTSHEQTRTHKTHHNPNLGEATTFPLIVFSMPSHEASTQISFCAGSPKWESRNSQN